jgi:high-affinity iron transporter
MERPMPRPLVMVGLLALAASTATATAGEVRGRVEMPDTCSPSVSPAVVTLEPIGGPAQPASKGSTAVALVNQHGLQFEPRVQVARVGQTIRFTNQDGETHNVHIITPGFAFNESMRPNQPRDFTPAKAGLIRLVCDIHSHMRGFVVVTASPWAKVCKGGGAFKFSDVPEGRYILNAWHEMGEPLSREVEVKGELLDLGTIVLKGFPVAQNAQSTAPVRPWPEVTDRIGVLLAEARESVKTPTREGLARARKLAEDAYWGEFETSDMETAVRRHLGYQRAGAIEGQFLGMRSALKSVSEGKMQPAELVTRSRKLLVDLAKASDDLKSLRINDRRDVAKSSNQVEVVALPGASEQAGQLKALAASFAGIKGLADQGRPDDAASAMTDAYFTDFEPLERLLNVRRPQEVTPLESRFNAIRGRIGSGLKGSDLAGELDGLRGEVVAALARAESSVAGSFSPAFLTSLLTILREGVEVILLLTMLVALVAKAGHPKGLGAIKWGIGVAVAASVLTAVGLNLLVSSAQGRTREVVEGAVMMAAAGVLFYVSYWLISQTQAKRWADFLKGRIARGAQVGGLWTLGLTAFLAVYREGAETALLYQALIAGQGGSSDGLMGLAAGLALGLVILSVLAIVIRKSSVKLPLRPFFQVTGFLLFAMAIVFAGNGVFELQSAGYIKTTALDWLGSGLPTLGLHPNTQSLSIQGLLLLGGLLAFVLPDSSTKAKDKAKVESARTEEEVAV